MLVYKRYCFRVIVNYYNITPFKTVEREMVINEILMWDITRSLKLFEKITYLLTKCFDGRNL